MGQRGAASKEYGRRKRAQIMSCEGAKSANVFKRDTTLIFDPVAGAC